MWNRAAFAQAFQRLADARPLTLAILDLDDLEGLNAARGFEVGNEVMRRAATVVQGTLREHDVMARLRGDEFAILLPRTSAAEAATLLEQAQAHLARTPVLVAPEFHVGFCAGVAAAKPGASLEDATTDAERALYWAKRRGPGSVVSSEQRAPAAARTVVLAEDDPVTATLVKHRLQREGFEVRHFQDGTSALAAADDDVALFILDVKMPGLDGFTLLRQLRANPRAASVPVLMLTAMGREEDIVRGFALGASDYVTKPFSPAELLARIRRLLK
jgi:diguanylate cyclase (GGDEF)-like protein